MEQAAQVRRAGVEDLDVLVPLFDAYRQFYRHPTDEERAKRFLWERLKHNESVVFLAFQGPAAIGFTQLFPTFSSGALARIYVLNDLYVAVEARRRGTGAALLHAGIEHARNAGAKRLVLRTEVTNATARSLYEGLGWKRDSAFYTYNFELA